MTMTGFNGDNWANPDNFAGAGVFESLAQTVDSMGRLGEGDAAELGLNAAALGLDALGVFMDPVGAQATAGIGWLIEHLSFLREPLDWLAGNGDKIKAAVGTWNQVSVAIAQIADEPEQGRAEPSRLVAGSSRHAVPVEPRPARRGDDSGQQVVRGGGRAGRHGRHHHGRGAGHAPRPHRHVHLRGHPQRDHRPRFLLRVAGQLDRRILGVGCRTRRGGARQDHSADRQTGEDHHQDRRQAQEPLREAR